MSEHSQDNLTRKNIREFGKGDTLYVHKRVGAYDEYYLVAFLGFKAGIVTGKILEAHPNPETMQCRIGREVTARITKCYLWGRKYGDPYPICHWFNAEGFAIE